MLLRVWTVNRRYAYDSHSSHHTACRTWLDTVFNGDEIVALPGQTMLAFVRSMTNGRAVPWARRFGLKTV